MDEIIVGLDFGTSNTAISYEQDGNILLCEIEGTNTTIPTAIFFPHNDDPVSVGRRAQQMYMDGHDGRYMRSLKSVLGTSLMKESTVVSGKRKSFKDILTDFLSEILQRARRNIGADIRGAVVGRPVFFHRDAQRDAAAESDLSECLSRAGLSHIKFQYEPVAAAFYYRKYFKNKVTALIVDIGGGTSDFSIIESEHPNRPNDIKFKILANNGVRLGGADFDSILSLKHAMPLFGYKSSQRREFGEGLLPVPNWYYHDMTCWEKIPLLYTRKNIESATQMYRCSTEPHKIGRFIKVLNENLGHEIAICIEDLKIKANANIHGEEFADFSFIEDQLGFSISSQLVDKALHSAQDIIAKTIMDTIKLAEIGVTEINTICLVGGSSEMQFIRRSIKSIFPNATIINHNIFEAVARGLSMGKS